MSEEFKDFMQKDETGGKVFKDSSEQFTSMVLEYKHSPSDELRKSIIILWQKMTQYKSSCRWCNNQRKAMIKGLDLISEGNLTDGYKNITSSISSSVLKNKLAKFFRLQK